MQRAAFLVQKQQKMHHTAFFSVEISVFAVHYIYYNIAYDS